MDILLTINSRVAGKKYEISAIEDGEIKWTTNRIGVAGKLTFDVVKHGEIIFHEGDQVVLTVDGQRYFVGYVFTKTKTKDKIAVVCYDMLRYLKAKQSYYFQGKTLTGMVRQIAHEFYLTIDEEHLKETGYVLPDKIHEGEGLFDIITYGIYWTGINTNKIYVLYDNAGKLALQEIHNLRSKYLLGLDKEENWNNKDNQNSAVKEYTYKTSIDESYNVVKLVQPNEAKRGDAYVTTDWGKIQEWGKLQYYEKVSENWNEEQINNRAINLLNYYAQTQRTLKLPCKGVPDIRAGSMVGIYIPELGDTVLSKELLVEKCTHTWTSNDHSMELEMKVYNG